MKLLFGALFTTCLLLLAWPSQATLLDDIERTRDKGEVKQAEQQALALLNTARSTKNTELEADVLFELGLNAMERNNYPEARNWLNQAKQHYQHHNDELSMAKTYRQIGLTYRYQSDYPTALEFLYKALAIYQSKGSDRHLAAINNSLGVVLEKMGQFTKAITYHQQALEINSAIQDQSGIASALYNLADVRRKLGDFELALEYFHQALTLDEASQNKKNIAYSSYKVGYVNMQLGNLAQARQFMQRAHRLFIEIGAKRDIDWALSGLADLTLKEGNIEKAQAISLGIIERAEQNGYRSLLLDTQQTLIETYMAQKRFSDALTTIESAIPLAESMGEQHKVSQLLALHVDTLEKEGQLPEAFASLKRQKQLDETLFNKDRLDAIASAQAQTEFIRQENQIALLKQQQAVQKVQAENERENRQNILLGLTIVVLLAFLLYSRRSQRQYSRKLEQEVELRTTQLRKANEELSALSLTDKLTGLKNRRFLEHQLHVDIANTLQKRRQSDEEQQPSPADLCLFVIDLDEFKRINDNYGHAAGDRVLQQTAQRLKCIFRGSDFVIRWGGEEFVAIARDVKRTSAEALAQRVIDDMQATPFHLGDERFETITCSVGFACFPFNAENNNSDTLEKIFTTADNCLYAAKASGRNTWVGVNEINDVSALPISSSVAVLEQLAANGTLSLSRRH